MPHDNDLQELLLLVHFQGELPLSVLALADWIQSHSSRFPIVQEQPVWPPVDLVPRMGIEWSDRPQLPRILLRSEGAQRQIGIQADRLMWGWYRIDPLGQSAAYPGFEIMLEEWKEELNTFYAWCSQHLDFAPPSRMVEIVYQNAAMLASGEAQRKISEVVGAVNFKGRPLNGLNLQWVEMLREGDPLAPRVSAHVQLGAIGTEGVISYRFNGLATVSNERADLPEAVESLRQLHGRTIDMHAATITSKASWPL